MRLRTILLSSATLLALLGVVAQAQGSKPMQTLQMPAMPDPARVTLDPKTTALMVLDFVEDICAAQPKCKSQCCRPWFRFLSGSARPASSWHMAHEHRT